MSSSQSRTLSEGSKKREEQDEIEIRPLENVEERLDSLKLQQETWGEGFNELTPPSLQMVAQKLGGVAAGAFSRSGEMVGFVFGLTGPRDGALVHWSHMVAVRKAWRGQGIGFQLKRYQRRKVLQRGITTMHWTYEPLEAVNAHFNINRLGVLIDDYHCDLYGSGESSTLHRGIGTDRFTVRWPLEAPRVDRALDGRPPEQAGRHQAPNVIGRRAEAAASTLEADLTCSADTLRVEIPPNIQSIKEDQPDRALQWRMATRNAFRHYLQGYEVDGFYRDADSGRCFYVLTRLP